MRIAILSVLSSLVLLLGGCEKAAPVVPPTAEEMTTFMDAAFNGRTIAVQEALKKGMPADHQDEGGFTPLMIAAHNGHVEVVKALIDAGATVSKPAIKGNTPLLAAALNDQLDTMTVLIAAGADVDERNDKEETPLMQVSSVAATRLLIENGADVNATEKTEKFTPIMYAAIYGLSPIVDVLLDAGADPAMQDIDGDTAATFARKGGFPRLSDKLQKLIDAP